MDYCGHGIPVNACDECCGAWADWCDETRTPYPEWLPFHFREPYRSDPTGDADYDEAI